MLVCADFLLNPRRALDDLIGDYFLLERGRPERRTRMNAAALMNAGIWGTWVEYRAERASRGGSDGALTLVRHGCTQRAVEKWVPREVGVRSAKIPLHRSRNRRRLKEGNEG